MRSGANSVSRAFQPLRALSADRVVQGTNWASAARTKTGSKQEAAKATAIKNPDLKRQRANLIGSLLERKDKFAVMLKITGARPNMHSLRPNSASLSISRSLS